MEEEIGMCNLPLNFKEFRIIGCSGKKYDKSNCKFYVCFRHVMDAMTDKGVVTKEKTLNRGIARIIG